MIEALHEMAEAWDRDLRVAATGRELSEEESDIQAQRYERARREIDRAVVLGAYILGIEAQERLREYQKRTRGGGNEHWVDVVVEASAAANDCLKDVIEIARRDMGADEASKWGRFGGRNLERLGRGD